MDLLLTWCNVTFVHQMSDLDTLFNAALVYCG